MKFDFFQSFFCKPIFRILFRLRESFVLSCFCLLVLLSVSSCSNKNYTVVYFLPEKFFVGAALESEEVFLNSFPSQLDTCEYVGKSTPVNLREKKNGWKTIDIRIMLININGSDTAKYFFDDFGNILHDGVIYEKDTNLIKHLRHCEGR